MSTTPDDGRPGTRADGEDETAGLGPALEVLRRAPVVPPGAVDRVMAAAVARGHRPAGAPRTGASRVAAGWRVAAGLLLAAGLGAVAWRGRPEPATGAVAAVAVGPVAPTPAPTMGSATDFLPAAHAAPADAPLPASFVLRRPGAGRVALVGDFNRWDPAAAPMRRQDDGTWTTTVTVSPGRHAYAFVVDDSTWVTDPRVPATRDVDYGRDHSIVVVGAP